MRFAWILAWGLLTRARTAGFANDGYQYLSVADNVSRGAKTSILILRFRALSRKIFHGLRELPKIPSPRHPAVVTSPTSSVFPPA